MNKYFFIGILLFLGIIVSGGVNALYCYQEFANESTICGGLGTGVYNINNNWNDGDWDTYESSAAKNLVNYTIPSNGGNNLWWAKYYTSTGGLSITNTTIPIACIDNGDGILQLKVVINTGIATLGMYGQCYNGATWTMLWMSGTSAGGEIYDEGVYWNMSSPIINITIPANGSVQLSNATLKVSITSSDFLNNSIFIYDSNNILLYNDINNTANRTINYNTQKDGLYYINATACSQLNDCISTDTRVVTIDNKKNFRFLSNLGAELIDNRLIILKDVTNTKYYNTTNGTLVFNITSVNTSFIASSNDSYANYSFTIYFNTTTDTINVYLSPAISILFMDEATEKPFNLSSPNSTKLEIYYLGTNTTTIILNGTTPNPYFLNITSQINSIRILTYYLTPNIVTVYRTYLAVDTFGVDKLDAKIWLVDVRTSDVILNTFQVFDLMANYQNPRILITKVINSTEEVITGDYADIEGKISAYLLRGAKYNIKVYSDNQPVRVIGDYYADEAGTKYIRLFDVIGADITSDYSALATTTYSTYLYNASGTYVIYSLYNGSYVTSVDWSVYNNSLSGNLLTTSTTTNTSGIFSYTIPTNHSGTNGYYVLMSINIDCAGSSYSCTSPIVYGKFVSVDDTILLPTFDKPYTIQWIIFLVLLVIALSFNFKTANIGSLLLIGLAGFLAFIGWFNVGPAQEGSYVVLAIAIIVALTGMFKKGAEK